MPASCMPCSSPPLCGCWACGCGSRYGDRDDCGTVALRLVIAGVKPSLVNPQPLTCGLGVHRITLWDVTPIEALLVYGATARLTRVITDDDIGLWWVRVPAYKAAIRHVERTGGDIPWWDRYRAGLMCPWCVGFWVGAGVLGSYAAAGKTRTWRFAAATLTLNLVAAPLVALLGSDSDESANETPPAGVTAGQRPTAHVG